MIPIARRLVLVSVVLCSVVVLNLHRGQDTDAAQQHTPVTVTRIYTGPDGQPDEEQLTQKFTPVQGTYEKWRDETQPVKAGSSEFARFAPRFFQDWHPAAARRYVVTLSGRGEVELANGQKISLGPGESAPS